MANEDQSSIREECFVDLLEWLEKAGLEANTADIARRLFEGRNQTCRSFGYHFDRIDTEGILEVRYYFPWSRLMKIIDPQKDLADFTTWFAAVNSKEVTLDVGEHKMLGKCVIVHRYYYVPEDQRDKWLGSSVVAIEEQGLLCKLLNVKPLG